MKKVYILLGCVIYFVCLYYLFPLILPFIFSVLCFFLMKPLIDYIEHLFHFRKSIIGMVILLIFYMLAFIVLMLVFYQIVIFFMKSFPYVFQIYHAYIEPQMKDYQPYISFLYEQGSQYFLRGLSIITTYFQKLPYLLFSVFIFIISTFYLVLEYDVINEKIKLICSPNVYYICLQIKNHFLKGLYAYFRCQLILLLISFFMIICVYLILDYPHSFLFAGITALLDALPFIGVGIVFLPLSIYYLFSHCYGKALYLVLVYVFMNMVRSFLEPHIMNKQMKIPSFFLLISMILHFHFFGVIGLILSPIHLTLIFELLEQPFHSHSITL